MYKAGANLLIIFYFYHATEKSMEISMYKAGPKLFVFFYFSLATGKSMEIQCTKLDQNYLHFTIPLVNPWKFPRKRLEQPYIKSINFSMPLANP